MPKKKRLLTIDDLVKFCSTNNFTHFDASEAGYQLYVQVPANFELSDAPVLSEGLMGLKIRVLHTELNRNHSYVSRESAERAMSSFAYKPVLAFIHQRDDGEWDFEAHNVEIYENEDGDTEIDYLERQIGTITADAPFFEKDETNGKEYVCCYAAVPELYTRAADIIRRKGGTKNSAELAVDKLEYDSKNHRLNLIDWRLSATTLLGSCDDGTEIVEGMEGSRADIADFSIQNNSVCNYVNNEQNELIKTLERLNQTISNFNNLQEGGKTLVTKFDELLAKYGKTADDITFDVEGLSDDELEKKFAEAFDSDGAEEGAAEPEPTSTEDSTVEPTNEPDATEDVATTDEPEATSEDAGEPNATDDVKSEQYSYTINLPDGTHRTFALNLEDIHDAIHKLVNETYAGDDDWYGVNVFDDNTVVMHSYMYRQDFRQAFTKNEDGTFALVGERVEVYPNYLTKGEEDAVNKLRENYDALKALLETYQKNELLESNDYSAISNSAEFASIKEQADSMSFADMKDKLDTALLNYAKSGNLNFAAKPTAKRVTTKVGLGQEKNKRSRYGSLFN